LIVHYHLRLATVFIRLHLKEVTRSLPAFFALVGSKAVIWLAEAYLLWIVAHRFKGIGGWEPHQVMILYSLNLLSYALAGFLFYHPFTRLAERARSGDLDECLTKPVSPLFYLTFREFSAGYLSNLLTALILFAIGITRLALPVSMAQWILWGTLLTFGAIIQAALLMLAGIPAFWRPESTAAAHTLIQELRNAGRLPLGIYPAWFQWLLTFGIPIAFVGYVPASVLFSEVPRTLLLVVAIMSALLAVIAAALWRHGIKSYQGCGS
jgi:ABC-2 type transport system permease protein